MIYAKIVIPEYLKAKAILIYIRTAPDLSKLEWTILVRHKR